VDWSAPHAGFVAAAYALTLAVFLALVAWVLLRDRANRRRITELEERGSPRRRPGGR
jgi:heme exporter protein CcmD